MLLLLIVPFLFATCAAPTPIAAPPAPAFPYDVNKPAATFVMPEKLVEISGLSLSADGAHLLAIQDEDGFVFVIDKLKGAVVREFRFHKTGDYEAVEAVANTIYVAKSNGNLYRITDHEGEAPKTEKIETFLSKEDDVEGLAYDAKRERLLLACKGADMTSGRGKAGQRAIYAFDLATQQLAQEPAYIIQEDAVAQFLGQMKEGKARQKLMDTFAKDGEDLRFNPSGLAIHPLTGHLYLLSSVGKTLMVLDEAGSILHIAKLNKKIHPQPEGICFDRDGTLFISNEGKDGQGNIHRFAMRSE